MGSSSAISPSWGRWYAKRLRVRKAVGTSGPGPASAVSSRREEAMDPNTKKTTLRMIPYGLYVLTAAHADGRVAAGTVNWVTQASFEPPLVAVGVKTDSHAHALIKDAKAFALNVLGKGQQALAFTFFKPAELKGETISARNSIVVRPGHRSSRTRRRS